MRRPLLDRWTTRNIVIAATTVVVLSTVTGAVASDQQADAITIALIGFPIGFVMAALVMGIQVVNPFSNERLYRLGCTFIFAISALVALWAVVAAPLDPASLPMAPTPAGSAVGAWFMWKRFGARMRTTTGPQQPASPER